MTSKTTTPTLKLPAWLPPLAILAMLYLLLPFLALFTRVPWEQAAATLSSSSAQAALNLSLITCTVSIGLDLLLGIPLALVLAKNWPGVQIIRVLVLLPLSVPPVVAGLALLQLFGRKGLVGPLLEAFGVTIAFTPVAVVMAQVFVSLPFLVVTVEAALRSKPQGLEQTARQLSAKPTRILWTVTLPVIFPAIFRGAALAAARCLGEFGATLTFAGSLQGLTRTMPLEVYLTRETNSDLALLLGAILLLAAVLVVACTEIPWGKLKTLLLQSHRHRQFSQHSYPAAALPKSQAVGVTLEQIKCNPRDVCVDFTIPAGMSLALMGHNGAGKTTIAELAAGTITPDQGRILYHLGAQYPEAMTQRPRVITMGQNPQLFPHLNVLDNVAFAPRSAGANRKAARRIAWNLLSSLELEHLAWRYPAALSGGQAAKVALARAIAGKPQLLILDEPTASLDVHSALTVTNALVRVLQQTGVTTILITHDISVCLALASTLALVDRGRIVSKGEPFTLLHKPQHAFTARLAGLNVVEQKLAAQLTATPCSAEPGQQYAFPTTEVVVTTAAPEKLSQPEGLTAQLVSLKPDGDSVCGTFNHGDTIIHARIPLAQGQQLSIGAQVLLTVTANQLIELQQ